MQSGSLPWAFYTTPGVTWKSFGENYGNHSAINYLPALVSQSDRSLVSGGCFFM